MKPSARGVALAALEDRAAEPAPRPVAADEHRAHARGLGRGVEQPPVVGGGARAGVEPVAAAPAAAGDDLAARLVHVVGAVLDQRHVELADVARGALGVPRVVEAREERADRGAHQRGDRRRVGGDGEALRRLLHGRILPRGAVPRRTPDSGAHAAGPAGAKEARAFGTPVGRCPFRWGVVSVSRGAAATRGAPDDRPESPSSAWSARGWRRPARATRPRARSCSPATSRSSASRSPTSDETIRERTGRGWEEWFDLLDEAGAADMSHREIARWLAERAGRRTCSPGTCRPWSAATSARAGGARSASTRTASPSPPRRPSPSRSSGSTRRSSTRTLRARWLPGAELRERTTIEPRSARFDWGDGPSRIHVSFAAKGEAKSDRGAAHERLPDAAEAERMKAFWRERVAGLKEVLEHERRHPRSGP